MLATNTNLRTQLGDNHWDYGVLYPGTFKAPSWECGDGRNAASRSLPDVIVLNITLRTRDKTVSADLPANADGEPTHH